MREQRGKQSFHNETLDKTTESRRRRIYEVAISEFAKNGYYGTSINLIAKKAEISIGAMYKYFASKEDLFLSIVNIFHEDLDNTIKGIMESDLSGLEMIEKMFEAAQEGGLTFPESGQIYHYATTQPMDHIFKKVFGELEPLTVQAIKYALEKIKKENNIDFDEHMIAYIIDNLLILHTMSFSSNYYSDRKKLYLGDEAESEADNITKKTMRYVKNMMFRDSKDS